MTVFNEENNSVDNAAVIEDYKKRFVKEDGTVDIDGLLKKSFHQESHIEKLEDEHNRFREDLKGRTTMEELVTELKKLQSSNSSADPLNPPNESINTPSPVDLEAVVSNKLTEFEQKLAQQRNVEYVKSELSKAWGSNYTEKLRLKAKELGESEQFLEQLAMTKPNTFLSLVNPRVNKVDNYTPPQTEIRTATASHTNLKSYADFERIRKEDPNTYWSPSVQNQLYKAAKEAREKGENFYSK